MTKINEKKNLRDVLSKFSTGVTVVTTINSKKNPIGIHKITTGSANNIEKIVSYLGILEIHNAP